VSGPFLFLQVIGVWTAKIWSDWLGEVVRLEALIGIAVSDAAAMTGCVVVYGEVANVTLLVVFTYDPRGIDGYEFKPHIAINEGQRYCVQYIAPHIEIGAVAVRKKLLCVILLDACGFGDDFLQYIAIISILQFDPQHIRSSLPRNI